MRHGCPVYVQVWYLNDFLPSYTSHFNHFEIFVTKFACVMDVFYISMNRILMILCSNLLCNFFILTFLSQICIQLEFLCGCLLYIHESYLNDFQGLWKHRGRGVNGPPTFHENRAKLIKNRQILAKIWFLPPHFWVLTPHFSVPSESPV